MLESIGGWTGLCATFSLSWVFATYSYVVLGSVSQGMQVHSGAGQQFDCIQVAQDDDDDVDDGDGDDDDDDILLPMFKTRPTVEYFFA